MNDENEQKRVKARRGGRPRKSESDKRKPCAMLRLNDDEQRQVFDHADAAKMSLAQYARHSCLAMSGATQTLTLPVSDIDHKAIQMNAIQAGYSFDEYCLRTLKNLHRPPAQKDREFQQRALVELNRVGINLDQALHDHRIPKKDKPAIQPILAEVKKALEDLAAQL